MNLRYYQVKTPDNQWLATKRHDMELQVVLNTYATDIFRNQADYDYISARANFRMQLRQQFLWASQQSVEKYLKAILLFNGKSARYYQRAGETKQTEFGHNLDALNNEVTKLSFLGYGLNDKDKSFLIYLNKQGGANRYLSTSAYNTPNVLQDLDRLVWNVRRYCQYIHDRGLGCKDFVPEMKEAVIRSINNPIHERQPHKFSISSGKLEEIVNREPRDKVRSTLVWANLFYGKKSRHKVTYNTFGSTDIPPNEREWNGVDWKIIKKYIKP